MKNKQATKHTPGKSCSTGFNVGQCGVSWQGANLKSIVFCPLHAAAPDLLEELKRITSNHWLSDNADQKGVCHCRTCAVIAKAEEK